MKTKHILIISLLICSTLGTGQAQDTLLVNPAKIDSLQQLIVNGEEDEEKVRLQNEYARLNFYNQEYKTGFIAAVEARELSAEINFSGGEIMFQITVATFLGRDDELEMYHLSQARLLSVQNNEADLYAVPTHPEGYPPAVNDEQLQKLLSALTYFEKSGNKEIQAIIMSSIGTILFRQGDLKNLLPFVNRAIKLYTDLNQLYPIFLYHKRRMSIVDYGDFDIDKKQLENELLEVLTRTTDKNQLIPFYNQLSGFYAALGQSDIAIDYYLKSVEFFKSTNNLIMLNEVYNEMSQMYGSLEMYEKQAEIVEKQIAIIIQLDHPENYNWVYRDAVWTMHAAKRYDKAREYMEIALQASEPNAKEAFTAQKSSLEGQILMDYNRYEEAIPFFKKTYNFYSKQDNGMGISTTPYEAMHLANCYYKTGELDEALRFGLIALHGVPEHLQENIRLNRKINLVLYEVYNALDEESQAFNYLKQYHEWVEKTRMNDNANLMMEAEVRSILEKSEIEITRLEQEQMLKEQQSKIQRVWIFSISGALLSALLVAIILYRNNKNKQKANVLLKDQKEEIQSTLERLEATQSQLIQSEKMASLGELTAGIAHEIQNPLNFVNNFSDVSGELVDELQDELNMNNPDVAREIAVDLKQNLVKINHHGQRASGIVKGMLEHSRTGDGVKEPTDLNTLADEYLRLAYHGLRAKDNSFNADFQTDFDKALPKVNVVPQDIGRVLLNLINNAFYAVDKRAKEGIEGYKPEVIISTKKGDKSIEICVKDNGEGIPEQVRDKIFQPFFTTKPTGSGTGLGLSLSYDIVKAHGGELRVESSDGKGSEFIIQLS